MPSLPISPDESSGEPLCRAECPSRTCEDHGDVCDVTDIDCSPGESYCLPALLDAWGRSRRRCDGCRHWFRARHFNDDGSQPDAGWCLEFEEKHETRPDDFCSRWEAKP